MLLGFLHEDFTRNDFFLDLALHFRRDGTARLFQLLGQRVGAGLGHGLAVHDGQVLRHGGGGQGQHGGGGKAGQDFFVHGFSLERESM